MNAVATSLPGVVVIEPSVFADDRGWLAETFRRATYADAGIGDFVQENRSRSRRSVLRGLHYQLAHPQAKLVYVTRGEVFDVAVDVRRGSPTFGQWFGTSLTEDNHRQLWIPAGFAHGFLAMSELADVVYKCSAEYDPKDGRAIRWDDPVLAIAWPITTPPILSATDASAQALRDAELPRHTP